MRLSIAAIVLVGCGSGDGGGAAEKAACERAKDLCSKDLKVDKCTTELSKLKKPMDDDYGKTLECANTAKSCAEMAGCFAGGVSSTIDRWEKQFEKGMKRFDDKDADRELEKQRERKKKVDDDNPFGDIWEKEFQREYERSLERQREMTKRWEHESDDWDRRFEQEVERHRKEFDKAVNGDPSVLAACTEYTFTPGPAPTAHWGNCPDKIVRDVRCEKFIDKLKCDCLEDGVNKWFFDATEPPFAKREDAERVVVGNCHMGFGH